MERYPDEYKKRAGVRRNLGTPEAVEMRKKIADGLDLTTPVVMKMCPPMLPGHKGNLKTWMYTTLTRLSNKYKMQQGEHDELLMLAERAYADGFDEGESWGYESGYESGYVAAGGDGQDF